MNDALAAGAQGANTSAYNNLASQACTLDLTGQDLGGRTLTEGVYCFSSSAQLTGALTLNATGNGVFVFKIGSTLTTASSASVAVNGGSTCNVFWQVGSSATLGTNTRFAGNILALQSITLNTGASVSGRALAQSGAVTLDTNNVGAAGCAVGVPTATPTATLTATASVTATATVVPATATATTSATPPSATPTQTSVPSGDSGAASTATPTATGMTTDTPPAATRTAVIAATSTAIIAANANAITAATTTTMAATAANNGVPSTSVSRTALPSASVATTVQPATQTAVHLATSTAITPAAAALALATQTAVRGSTATAIAVANAAATAVATRAPTQTTAPRGGGVPSELSLAILVAGSLAVSSGLALRRRGRRDATVQGDSNPTV